MGIKFIRYGDMSKQAKTESQLIKVLVVEDSPTQIAKLRFSLETAGYQVLEASNGIQGLATAREQRPQLIISDVNMPEMDGFEMCARIKADPDLRDIPLLLLTTLSDPESLLKGLEAGADYHISKPYDQDLLLSKTGELIEGEVQKQAVDGPDDVEISIQNNSYRISASRGKILNFLLATYEDAAQRNFRLQKAEEALYGANQELEARVAKRTDQLRHAAQEWRECFDSLEDMMVLVDSNYCITRVNQRACQMLGMDFHEILGKPCYEIIHGTMEPPDFCPHHQLMNGGESCQHEYEEPHLGKTVSISYSPMRNTDGQVDQMVHIITDVTEIRQQREKTNQLTHALATAFSGVTQALSDLSAIQDPYTAGHARNVAHLAVRIAEQMGIDKDQQQGLWVCGLLHDIGKVSVSPSILNKPGKLSEHEWGIISGHPEKGYEALKKIPFPWPVADVVRQHHERMDASGYPGKLAGDEVHVWARILAVADVVDAMMNDRPYRPGLAHQVTIEELEKGKGKSLDPRVVDAYMQVLKLEEKNVLIIDDDHHVLQMMAEHLNQIGYNPIPFDNAGQGLQYFRENKCHLVVTDLRMPVVDGLEVIRQVRKLEASSQVIVVSAYGDKQNIVEALRLGASDFLEKPLKLMVLTNAVEKAFSVYFSSKR